MEGIQSMNCETPRPPKTSIAGSLMLFAAGFFLAAAAIHLLLPNGIALYGAERSEKLVLLDRTQYAYPSAFFGSSHVNEGFDPRVFDATLASAGVPMHSINMGLNGGSHVEQRIVAQYFLDHMRPSYADRPCVVMLEASAPRTFALTLISHPRHVNILDLHSAWLVTQFTPDPGTRFYHLHLAAANLESAALHLVNLGMLSNWIFRPANNEALIKEQTENDKRGLRNQVADQWSISNVKTAFDRRKSTPTLLPSKLDPGHAALVEDLHKEPNGSRVQFMWVVMPRLRDLIYYNVYPDTQKTSFGDVPIVNLARPDLYPELYERSLWMDNQHFTEEGAAVNSRIFAKLVADWFHDHPNQMKCGG